MTDHTISSDGKIERMIEERWCVPLGAGEPRCIKATGVSCVPRDERNSYDSILCC